MVSQEISLEVPSQGARRATGEESTKGWKKAPSGFRPEEDRGRAPSATRGASTSCRANWGMPAAPDCDLARSLSQRGPGGDDTTTPRFGP